DEAVAVAGCELQRDVLEKNAVAEGESEVADADHGCTVLTEKSRVFKWLRAVDVALDQAGERGRVRLVHAGEHPLPAIRETARFLGVEVEEQRIEGFPPSAIIILDPL